MDAQNNKNLVLAIVLSIIVLIGWQYFYVSPKIEQERRLAEIQAERDAAKAESGNDTTSTEGNDIPDASNNATSDIPGTNNTGVSTANRTEVISAAKRVPFENDHIKGSVNLKAGRIDDLELKDHRVALDKSSDLVTLLSPAELADGYFTEFGFSASSQAGKVPGPTTEWNLVSGTTLSPNSPIILEWKNDKGLTFTRTVKLDENFLFTYEDKISNSSAQNISVSPYGRITRFGEPDVEGFFILHEGLIGYFGEEGLVEYDYSDIKDEKEYKAENKDGVDGGWIGITDKYWATAIIPDRKYKPRYRYFDDGRPRYQSDFLANSISVPAGGETSISQRIFAGAKNNAIVDQYWEDEKILGFEKIIDWGWFHWITKPLAKLMTWLYGLLGNFGLAILATTVLIKIALFYFANLSYASMAKMKKVQPQMTQIKERYGDDRMKQQQEMMALYKKENINPAAGCWPLLIQIPVFFALYKVIYITIEMRHAPFVGWIQDLSAPDPTSIFNLFGLLPYDVPGFLLIGIWPLIMGVTMFLQMQMNPAPPDPTQAMIFKWMPVVFTFMLATFPAGLVIYWAWNNTLSLFQQGFIMKRHGVKIELLDNLKSMFSRKKPDGNAK